ncbi:glutamyl-tRNA reductase, partial [Butyricicoccus sp. 1XD8-22]
MSIENKMPNLTDRERKILNKHTKSIINQLLKEPILQAKELANSPKAKEQLQLFQQIFGIEDAVQEELNNLHVKEKLATENIEAVGNPKLSY